MKDLLLCLKPKQRKGSNPRCHWLTHGTRKQVAKRLTKLTSPWGIVSENDYWMPEGFCDIKEVQLHTATGLLPCKIRDKLDDWWLVDKRGTRPQWDIASTCKVNGSDGILLVEAKAHTKELNDELKGKPLTHDASVNSRCNHIRIGEAIEEANVSLMDQTERVCWSLQRDQCYQMSNRFAWSWKLTELGYSVIIVYLGFTNAAEMTEGEKQVSFADHSDWESCVLAHSQPLFPTEVWNKKWPVHNCLLVPRICSCEIRYDAPIEDD